MAAGIKIIFPFSPMKMDVTSNVFSSPPGFHGFVAEVTGITTETNLSVVFKAVTTGINLNFLQFGPPLTIVGGAGKYSVTMVFDGTPPTTVFAIEAVLMEGPNQLAASSPFTITPETFSTKPDGIGFDAPQSALSAATATGPYTGDTIILLQVTVKDSTEKGVDGMVVRWRANPAVSKLRFLADTTSTGTDAPIDPFTGDPYSVTANGGIATVSLVSSGAAAPQISPQILGLTHALSQQVFFGNPLKANDLILPAWGNGFPVLSDAKNSKVWGPYIVLSQGKTESPVELVDMELSTNAFYWLMVNGTLVNSGEKDAFLGVPMSVAYASLMATVNEEDLNHETPPPDQTDINGMMMWVQGTSGSVFRSPLYQFWGVGQWEGNVPKYGPTGPTGDPYNRILAPATILGTEGGLLGIEALLNNGNKLKVAIPRLPSKYTGKDATVYLYMNGYVYGKSTEKHSPTDKTGSPYIKATVKIEAGGTDVPPYAWELVYGYSASGTGQMLRSYVDFEVDGDWMEYTFDADNTLSDGQGYQTNVVYPGG